jgi:hypothetical protein
MKYALWSIPTNNLLAEFDNERDALSLVLEGIERNGPASIESVSLDVEDDNGNIVPIAHGAALVHRARQEFSQRFVVAG